MHLHVVDDAELLAGDLLLEERVHDDRRRAGVLEPADGVQVVRKWRRSRHEWVRQVESEIGRAEVHRVPHFPALWPANSA